MIFKENDVYELKYSVTEERYKLFIELSEDKNPLHSDELFAISKGFQGKVMHGNILNCFLSYFIGEYLPIKNVIIHAQEIQFKKPVYLNDELILKAKVNGVFESVNAVEFGFSFINSKTNNTLAKGKIQIGILL
jgi:3-hydroxybutyryl-CoA dehydratase